LKASDRTVANQRGAQWAARLRQAVREDGAYLVPLRLFVGLGWLRACAEKVLDPGWRDGSSLAAFLSDHVSAGDIAFPWYETLIAQVFLPHAVPLALLIMLGQFLAGAAIAAGVLTNAALLGGLFMNLNFLLAGAPNPSAFYIVIQAALLLTNAGAILGLDTRLAKTMHNPLLVAQPPAERRRRRWRGPALPIGAISLITAIYSLAYVTDWSPAGSVEDPAMIVAILALLSLAWATIAWLRQDARGRRVPRRLALTVTLAWSDEPDDGGDPAGDQPAGVAALRTAPRTGAWQVPAGS
jgi:thiosulfate dehydrogenase (quinone) large subunit